MKIIVDIQALIMARITAGLSQRQLSVTIKASTSYISQLEKGDINPSPEKARYVCTVLNKEFKELFSIRGVRCSEHHEHYTPSE